MIVARRSDLLPELPPSLDPDRGPHFQPPPPRLVLHQLRAQKRVQDAALSGRVARSGELCREDTSHVLWVQRVMACNSVLCAHLRSGMSRCGLHWS